MICREIDTVTVKGSVQPIRLFTVDINFENLQEKNDKTTNMNLTEKRNIRNLKKKALLLKIKEGKTSTWDLFSKDKDFKELRKSYNKRFA